MSSALRLVMFYDLASPQSWVAYQLLQRKLPNWRKLTSVSMDYVPVNHIQIFKCAYNVRPEGVLRRKRDYLERELYDICDAYGLEKGTFKIDDTLPERRSAASLLLLHHLKQELPDYYERFMVAFWRRIWSGPGSVIRTTQYLKVARELGVPFRIIDRIVLNTEKWDNVVSVVNATRQLRDEGALGCPWFKASFDEPAFTYPFGDILRLETLEALISDKELLRRAAQATFGMGSSLEDTAEAEARSHGRLLPSQRFAANDLYDAAEDDPHDAQRIRP